MGFPPFLLSVREYCAHGQVEANNNTAGTPLNSTKPIITVKLNIFLFTYCDEAFILNMLRNVYFHYYPFYEGSYPPQN